MSIACNRIKRIHMGFLMKKLFIVCMLLIILIQPCLARDIIVEFIEENYKETQAQFSYKPLIYHSIQVKTDLGPKMLILTGDDYNYRTWLRYYIANNKKFITKIPDDRMDEFISEKAYEIDVTFLHPFNGGKWEEGDPKSPLPNTLKGDNNILIVDANDKRTDLIQTIVNKMGYNAIIFKTGQHALDFFKLQPGKFKIVITQYTIQGMLSEEFVARVLDIDPKMPIIIDTGYQNQDAKEKFMSKFSDFRSVHLKPAVLRDLQKTIDELMNKNA